MAFRKLRIIRYWTKTINTDNLLLKNLYKLLFNDAANSNTYNGTNWACQVKTLLYELGYNFVWDNQAIWNKIPYLQIKQRILDTTDQTLILSTNSSTKLRSYCIFKQDTEHKPYLNFIRLHKYKLVVSDSVLIVSPLNQADIIIFLEKTVSVYIAI